MAGQAELQELWESMVMARAFDRAMTVHNPHWHEARGEEGVSIGGFGGLRDDDVSAPHFRGTCAIAILRGEDPAAIAAGVFGKQGGLVGGNWRGDISPAPSRTLFGMYSGSLGTTVSYATGAALHLKQLGGDSVSVCSFGDGTANAGIVSESLNLAAMLRLPIVYLCQDNQYATSLASTVALAGGPLSVRARAFGLESADVDGNDVVAVRQARDEAVERARAGGGPTLINARTYRMGGHYMNDPEAYRSREEVEEWGRKDPIARLERRLAESGEWDAAEAEARRAAEEARFERIVEEAKAGPEAPAGAAAAVYSGAGAEGGAR